MLVSINAGGGRGGGGGGEQRTVVVTGQEGWEYRDPEGRLHGPYRAAQIIKWLNQVCVCVSVWW